MFFAVPYVSDEKRKEYLKEVEKVMEEILWNRINVLKTKINLNSYFGFWTNKIFKYFKIFF
jgi:hypothetical protein